PWLRRPRGERADVESGSVEERPSREGDRSSAARRSPPSRTPRASRPQLRRLQARTDRRPPPLLPARGVRSRTAAQALPQRPPPRSKERRSPPATSRRVRPLLRSRGRATGQAVRDRRGSRRSLTTGRSRLTDGGRRPV